MLLGHKRLNMTGLMFMAGQFHETLGLDYIPWDFLGRWLVEKDCGSMPLRAC